MSSDQAAAAEEPAPSSILIIGSGVFGLTTAYELAQRPRYASTTITVLDRSPVPGPSQDAASVDSSRIIRADYADPAYARLAAEAQIEWRKTEHPSDLGAEGRYSQSGLCLVADPTPMAASAYASSAPSPSPPRTVNTNGQAKLKAKKTSLEYVRESYSNVVSLAGADGDRIIRELPTPTAIKDFLGTPIAPGTWGYINPLAGWADAGAAMSYLAAKVQALGRVNFVSGTATHLNYGPDRRTVTGATLDNGVILSADLVVVAAGAWTGQLIDLSGQAIATGQAVGYIDITPSELEVLRKMPVTLNFSTGLFMIPPAGLQLKVARHAFGYLNPTPIPHPSPSAPSSARSTVSLPATHLTDPRLKFPKEGEAALREAVRTIVPIPAIHNRPFAQTRLCWYTDTQSGDFLVCHHPEAKNLFVATGGSGHGFKFLPVLGREIVNVLERRGDEVFTEKWRWRETKSKTGVTDLYEHIMTEDGSRGGIPGLLLKKEQAKL
ncbi:FAD dependent oxidoreductase [Colletotrichum graminicola]|uniref:FAD dependent oxidoreductase n=1 Tax=Colletotrichum graminicola (strain M1.001 / M2 / FGSC 10212) TaxID=645133 RepID=E3QRS9_COLGM|nr:FAD dependent oxidoreductase [Colletotrichum graminicola M1.001]EFQ33567.1 FAD dependent oxidoreductase [Colletotrichum graminicola M1.001]WDK22226.1 FAD dependent oxidoreductase [Colletotrichum graminicola]